MADTRNDMADMATARANVYGLLAEVFREEPSAAFLKKLRAPEFSGALRALDLSLVEVLEDTPEDQLAESLGLEYTRLFIGPGSHIPPNESMHVSARFGEPNSLWGPSTVAVKKFMQAAGVKIADTFTGMPDHLSAEFEFMQQLLLREFEAWSNDEIELGTNILRIEKRFHEEHLSQWVSNFCDKVIEAAEYPFYRQFSEITKGFIDFEEVTMQDLIAEVTEGGEISA
ncbi:MAG: molecular chaperone [Paracoccaceae bacterium]